MASLDLFDFGVLLQALATNLKVGVLAVRSGPREKFLHLDREKLKRVYTAKPKMGLDQVLYDHRIVERAPLDELLVKLRANPQLGPLSQLVVHEGLAERRTVDAAMRYQLVEEVLEIFYWKNIGFEFYPEDAVDHVRRQGLVPVGIPSPLDWLLVRCTQIVDDVAKFNEVTPSLRDIYELRLPAGETVDSIAPEPENREFLRLVDGVRDMREVLRDMRMNRFEALKFFYHFRTLGHIQPKETGALVELIEMHGASFPAAKLARLYERVDQLAGGPDVMLPLAQTYERMRRPNKAAKCYVRHARRALAADDTAAALGSVREAIRLRPASPELRTFEIEVLARQGSSAEAAEAWRGLAEIRVRQGAKDGARQAFERALELDSERPDLRTELSELLHGMGRRRAGASQMRRAGEAYYAQGDRDAAIQCYRRALRMHPRSHAARYRLVALLDECGRHNLAVQELGRAVELVTHEMPGLRDSSRIRYLKRVEDRLRAVGGLASSVTIQLAQAFMQYGAAESGEALLRESANSLAAAKRYGSAVEVYAELIEIAPGDLGIRRGLARAHRARGDRDRALGQLRRIGAKLSGAKEYALAREVFEEMLDVDPTCLDAHAGLAKSLLELGDVDLAATHYHRASLLHRATGRAEEAIPHLHEAIEKRPDDAKLLDEYCELLSATARDAETLEALARLVELHMESDTPWRAAVAISRILAIDPEYPGGRKILERAAKSMLRLAESTGGIAAAVQEEAGGADA